MSVLAAQSILLITKLHFDRVWARTQMHSCNGWLSVCLSVYRPIVPLPTKVYSMAKHLITESNYNEWNSCTPSHEWIVECWMGCYECPSQSVPQQLWGRRSKPRFGPSFVLVVKRPRVSRIMSTARNNLIAHSTRRRHCRIPHEKIKRQDIKFVGMYNNDWDWKNVAFL